MLRPTHYAIIIYPKSFSQQLSIERDSTLSFSYIFDQIISSNDTKVNSPTSAVFEFGPSLSNCIMEEDSCPYDSLNTTPLHVLWPVDKPIPSDIEYELCYEVFDPNCSDLPQDIVSGMMYYLTGDYINIIPQIPGAYITLRAFDNFLEQYIPLKNISIKVDYGSILKTYKTDSNGVAYIPRKYGETAFCSYLLTQDQFSVRDSISSAIVERSLGYISIGNSEIMTDTYYTFNRPEAFYEMIYQAADYFFQENTYGTSDISQLDPIPLFGKPGTGGYLGLYYPTSERIEVFDKNQTQRRNVIGTTLHELGHYYQHKNRTGIPASQLSNLFKESFASCNGYFLGEEYYITKGFIKPSSSYHIVAQDRQTWTPNLTTIFIYYSPIFVDLIDNYNQHTYATSARPDDQIENTSFDIILQIAKDANNLTDIRSYLISELTPQYSVTEIDAQLSYYSSFF